MFADVFKPVEPESNVLANVNAPWVVAIVHWMTLECCGKPRARLSFTTAATRLQMSRKDTVTGCPPWSQNRPLAHT